MIPRIRLLGVIAATVRGGAEETFAALLRGLDRSRFEVFVACDGTGPMYEEYRKYAVNVWPMDLSSPTRLSSVWKLVRLIRTCRCDIVHTQLWNADVLGGVAARLAGVPSVASVQGAYFLAIGIGGVRRVRRLAMSRVYRSIYHTFDAVVCVSGSVREDLLQRPGIRAPQRVEVVRNGLDFDRIARLEAEGLEHARAAAAPRAKGPRVLNLANFFPIKGQDWLIRAVPAVAARFPAVEFVLAGDGESLPAMRELARTLGVERHVVFPGSIPNPIAALLDADLFVLPSISEGLSIALLEAMAVGVPVVATAAGGNAEVVTDGETGVLVPPADPDALGAAINALLSDRDKASRLAASGRQMVRRRFAPEEMVSRMEALYTRLAGSSLVPVSAQ